MHFDIGFHWLQRRHFLKFGLFSCAFLLTAVQVSAQVGTLKRTSRAEVTVRNFQEIPKATEPCTPEECEWWKRLREAGNRLVRYSDQKSERAYASLFVEGIEKAYRIPLKDRSALALFIGPMVKTSDLPSEQRNGTVKLSVERRADGSVGDVNVLTGLGPEVDQRCMQAARRTIFLPAVKDRKFVTEWQTPAYKFFHAK